MNDTIVELFFQKGPSTKRFNGTRITFSAYQCFRLDGDPEEKCCLEILGNHLLQQPGLAIFGNTTPLYQALLDAVPALASHWQASIVAWGSEEDVQDSGVFLPEYLPDDVHTVFLAHTRMLPRMQIRKRFPQRITVIEPDILVRLALAKIPPRAWIPIAHNIYPIDIPDIRFELGQDLIVVDGPARNLAQMPNGLGYLNNALKLADVTFQIFDLDIVTYHRFHIHRLFDIGETIVLPGGLVLPEDPWQPEHSSLWTNVEVLDYMMPIINEAATALIQASPKVIGFSVHQYNELFTRRLIELVKPALPNTMILLGGYSCYHPNIGLRIFPQADYMCISESDLTVGPLVEALARGERPKNMPGVLSRFDNPDCKYIPGPIALNLDHLEKPNYDWFNLELYLNFNGYQLTPVIASRGCRWARCKFCSERFFWRIRSAENVVDELEYLFHQGCTLFVFTESDINGKPERLLEICDEIIHRNLHIRLTGQLRIHKKIDLPFFQKLKEAGFTYLRFGVDAFSRNTLKLQNKGYTVEHISQNLRACHEAGIFTEVNWVIGVPGETDTDVQEGIDLIIANKPYIDKIGNINPLILVNDSPYWLEPGKNNIKFLGDKKKLYEEFPRALPADKWYSTDPFITAKIRKERFERIILALVEAGITLGSYAQVIFNTIKEGKDSSRSIILPEQQEIPGHTTSECHNQKTKREKNAVIIPYQDQLYAISAEELASVIPPEKKRCGTSLPYWPGQRTTSGTYDCQMLTNQLGEITRIISKNAVPELMCSLGNYNVVRFAGAYYAIPFSHGPVDWRENNLTGQLGVIMANTPKKIISQLQDQIARGEMIMIAKLPRLIGSIEGYNLVEYDGYIYGISQSAGPLDLSQIDASQIPGVIWDTDRTTVEQEILKRVTTIKLGKM